MLSEPIDGTLYAYGHDHIQLYCDCGEIEPFLEKTTRKLKLMPSSVLFWLDIIPIYKSDSLMGRHMIRDTKASEIDTKTLDNFFHINFIMYLQLIQPMLVDSM